ncbi:unnamed protein product [Linum trigynum]|uniref:NUC153 domain-containing protein n=1 Tax=Linum trigynum TaxID=586398 RepID=A0AAV2F7Y6_9ROSI
MKSDKKKKQISGLDSNGRAATGGEMVSDPRFAMAHTDPRFQKVPQRKTKVAIDSRFKRMFTDKNFGGSSTNLDKRGRRKKQDSKSLFRHYYHVEEGEEKGDGKLNEIKSEEEESEKDEPKKPVLVAAGSGSSSEADDHIEEDDEEKGEGKLKEIESEREESEKEEPKKPVLAGSESSSEAEAAEDSDNDEVDDAEDGSTTDEEDAAAGVLFEDDSTEVEVENVPIVEDGTRRLAAVNMDWRHVRAADLFVVLRSFLPSGGVISSVAVYPSEFGLERMKEEEVHGPVGLFDDEENNEDDDSTDEIDEEKLRAYEKTRLRYYFAVVECDSIATAEYLYNVCDGVEFERSSNVLDLRFIPDSMEFKHPPRDIATEAPSSYDGIDFHTKALQHSNIPISWDEDEPQRVKTLKRKFNADQVDDKELQEFLASDEGESDENEDDADNHSSKKHSKGDQYRALIQSGDGSDEDEKEEGQDMEVTFNAGLENLSKRFMEKKDKKSRTVWEEYLRKRKEKKAARKQKSKSKYSSDDEESSSDDDAIGVENADDFFVQEPSADDKGSKKGVAQAKGKKGKKSRKENENEVSEEAATTAELELLLADDKGTDDGPKGYNLKPKKSKNRKKGKEVPDKGKKLPAVDYDDPRFSSFFKSPLFALDPTDPQFKRSAAYAKQMEKQQRKGDPAQSIPADSETTADEQPKNLNNLSAQKVKHELSSLVKSIKMKSKQLEQPSNSKASKKEHKSMKLKRTESGTVGHSKLVQSVKKKTKTR